MSHATDAILAHRYRLVAGADAGHRGNLVPPARVDHGEEKADRLRAISFTCRAFNVSTVDIFQEDPYTSSPRPAAVFSIRPMVL